MNGLTRVVGVKFMHDTLLIKSIEPEGKGFRNVFFQIGDMRTQGDRLLDLLNGSDSPYAGRCMFRFNGIRLQLEAKEIPTVLAFLLDAGMEVYSVYEPYI